MAGALVLGVGNILMQDEGVGVRALEWLQARCAAPEVELVDGGTMGLDLLHYLEGIDHLLILDAIEAGETAGEIITLAGEAVPAFLSMKISAHQIGVQDLLATAQLMGCTPPEVAILGVQPARLRVGLELSPAVAAQVEPLARLALLQLEQWGYQIRVADFGF
jgi:hydrogenase maturation protease